MRVRVLLRGCPCEVRPSSRRFAFVDAEKQRRADEGEAPRHLHSARAARGTEMVKNAMSSRSVQ
eukprot:11701258-Alexandrium_andersonii.AAC.1